MKENTINLVTYNLHGLQRNDEWRFGKIAAELNKLNAGICGFQEVINGNNIEDTSYQIAYHLRNISGLTYTTHWLYCHDFNEVYPEGLSILSCHPMSLPVSIDLNEDLSCGFPPLLKRFALVCEFEIFNHKLLFITLHLDHHKKRKLRTSQAEKLLKKLEEHYNMDDYICSVITGDFNDLDTSPCLKYFKEHGYIDTYRKINRKWGNTFHSLRPTVRIDYILIKGNVKVEKSDLILYDSSLSDHIGIMTAITLPEERGEIKSRELSIAEKAEKGKKKELSGNEKTEALDKGKDIPSEKEIYEKDS